jgi:hypothetical protein
MSYARAKETSGGPWPSAADRYRSYILLGGELEVHLSTSRVR